MKTILLLLAALCWPTEAAQKHREPHSVMKFVVLEADHGFTAHGYWYVDNTDWKNGSGVPMAYLLDLCKKAGDGMLLRMTQFYLENGEVAYDWREMRCDLLRKVKP